MSVNNIKCSVSSCHSRKGRTPHLSFHQFPKHNEALVYITNELGVKEKVDKYKAWTMVLKMEKPARKSMKVCSLHFNTDDYTSDYILADLPTKRPRLKLCAVPSRNLPESTVIPQINLSPKPKKSELIGTEIQEKTVILNKRIATIAEVQPDNDLQNLTTCGYSYKKIRHLKKGVIPSRKIPVNNPQGRTPRVGKNRKILLKESDIDTSELVHWHIQKIQPEIPDKSTPEEVFNPLLLQPRWYSKGHVPRSYGKVKHKPTNHPLNVKVEKEAEEPMNEISIKEEPPETIESIFIEEPASTIINELFIKDESSLGHDDIIIKEEPIR